MVALWRHLWSAGGGMEHLILRDRRADSLVLWAEDDGRAFRLACELEWDEHGATRRFAAHLAGPSGNAALELRADGHGAWAIGGAPAPELDGCLDVDLWPSPFTNTLAIQRLRLAAGATALIRVVYVRAPELLVTAERQRYTSLGRGGYRFESVAGAVPFTAELTTDAHDLVVAYPGLFERVV